MKKNIRPLGHSRPSYIGMMQWSYEVGKVEQIGCLDPHQIVLNNQIIKEIIR